MADIAACDLGLELEDIYRLFRVACDITDDIADQAVIVTMCVRLGIDHHGLRARHTARKLEGTVAAPSDE